MKCWILLVVLLGAAPPAADNWTEFRGPSGSGHSDAKNLPREWSETKNVVWKAPLHGRGWSSPVVWGKKVWLTTATPEGKELFVICVDRETGKVLMDAKLFDIAKPEETKKFNSFASPSPVIEEGRVYISFGSYGTACLNTETGKPVWTRTDLTCNHWRGPGSSPILWQNLLILHFDGYDQQYVVALDKKTGRTVWKSDRTHDFGTQDGDMKKAFSTPVVIEVGGKHLLISPAAKAALALDVSTGKEVWRVTYGSHSVAARPLVGHGMVYIGTGTGKDLVAVKPDGKGDVTKSHVAWTAKGFGHKPSGILVDDLIYGYPESGGLVTCIDAKTGEKVWAERVGATGHTASPLYADGVLYIFAEDGSAVMLQPGKEFKIVGRAKLEATEVCATPAIAGSSIFYRTNTHLYRIENR